MESNELKKVATWRIVLAFLLDFVTSFSIFGYIIALIFGGITDGGFSLEGGPALLLFALVIVYFVVFGRYLGGTLWQRVLGATRRT